MKTHKRWFSTRGVQWAGVAIVSLLGLLWIAPPKTTHAENERVVTIFHDGAQHTIVTDAPTIDEALKRANITLGAKDTVEPARDTKLVAAGYDVNVYRARPVTISDGNDRYQVMSPHTSARQIVADAGLTLYNEDIYQLTRIDDFLAEGGVGLKLTIERATLVNLVLYGKTTPVRTQAKTVGELLKDKNIVLGKDDTVNIAAQAPITANVKLEVWRNGVQTATEEQEIAFPIEQIRDADREIGYHQVQTPGVKGKKMVTYQLELKNGQQISRKEIQSVVTVPAQKQIEAIGIKPKNGPADIAANQALGHRMMLAAGFGEDQWPCLLNLWNHESGWDQYKANRAGSGAYGIPQALPGSKMGAGWQTDPAVQIGWGLGYIKGKANYRTPCGAWNFWLANKWY